MDAPQQPPPQPGPPVPPPGAEHPEHMNVVGDSPAGKAAVRKRKKPDEGHEPQPRRLRRLHEACARCRRKKIKCDSKHPSCSACEAANVECNQEDRHRQTLKPRGYTDLLEAQVDKCAALLTKLIPGFKLEYIDYHLNNYGIHPTPQPGMPGQDPNQPHPYNQIPYPPQDPAMHRPYGVTAPVPYPPASYGPPLPGRAYAQLGHEPQYPQPPPPQHHSPQAGPSTLPPVPKPITYATTVPYPEPHKATTPPNDGPPGTTVPPALVAPAPPAPAPAPVVPSSATTLPPLAPGPPVSRNVASAPPIVEKDIPGQDPMSNDMSSSKGLIRAFGVSKSIVKDLKPESVRREDILGGVSTERKYNALVKPEYWTHTPLPRQPHWEVDRDLYLPRYRDQVREVVEAYFKDLNPHRPVFVREDFWLALDALYDSLEDPAKQDSNIDPKYKDVARDPGFICSVYLVFALGSLCVENRRLHNAQPPEQPNWPRHEEFYDLALALKGELTNTMSTLQALVLLHWYLYTERHGKSLWRIVGNLIRLAVELGLHHDPRDQPDVFTPEECHLRMRIWWICLVHDRGTSVIFGRPLAVQEEDFNTPLPDRFITSGNEGEPPLALFSEHFDLGSGITEVQAEIVNSLYRPGTLSGEEVVERAINIERMLHNWRQRMPEHYKPLFRGTSQWTQDDRVNLVLSVVNADRGLTMLKYGIVRILLLRAIFNNKNVSAHVRFRALHDAVIMSHNVLIIHAQLTSFPETAFFVSPIPIHVAAMVILFATISNVQTLTSGLAKEDVCLALKLVPLFRWRWTRQDSQGSHPLIVRLARKVYGNDLLENHGPVSPPMLFDEMYWVDDDVLKSVDPPDIEKIWNTPANLGQMQELGYPQHLQSHSHYRDMARERARNGEDYDPDQLQALMAQLADQQAPTQENIMQGGTPQGGAIANPPYNPQAIQRTRNTAEPFDVWNNRR